MVYKDFRLQHMHPENHSSQFRFILRSIISLTIKILLLFQILSFLMMGHRLINISPFIVNLQQNFEKHYLPKHYIQRLHRGFFSRHRNHRDPRRMYQQNILNTHLFKMF